MKGRSNRSYQAYLDEGPSHIGTDQTGYETVRAIKPRRRCDVNGSHIAPWNDGFPRVYTQDDQIGHELEVLPPASADAEPRESENEQGHERTHRNKEERGRPDQDQNYGD